MRSFGKKNRAPEKICEVKYFWEEEQPCVKSYPCVKQRVDKNTCCDEVKEGGNKLGKLFPPCLERTPNFVRNCGTKKDDTNTLFL